MNTHCPVKPSYVSPLFLIMLRNYEFNPNIIRFLAKEIPSTVIYEACARGDISCEEGSYIITLQRESSYWVVRAWHRFWNWIL